MRRSILIFTLLLAVLYPAAAQHKGTGPGEPSAKEELRIRKQKRKAAKERKKLEKEERKKIREHHKRIQTKDVQKRMKKSRKSALRNNDNKREFFMKRWFTKKGKPVRKKKD